MIPATVQEKLEVTMFIATNLEKLPCWETFQIPKQCILYLSYIQLLKYQAQVLQATICCQVSQRRERPAQLCIVPGCLFAPYKG